MYLYAIIHRQHSSKRTSTGYSGSHGEVKAQRWEWGIGKGRWKRQARKAAQVFDMEGHVRVVFFGIGSYYRLNYTGTARAADLLYDEIA